MKKITVLLTILVAITIILSGCGEITTKDIAGKYYIHTDNKDAYYLLDEKQIEFHNDDGSVEKYGEYTLQDAKISFKDGSKETCFIYEETDNLIHGDTPLQGEIPDGDRFNTQCELTNATDSVGVNAVYKFKDDGTLTIENKTESILGNLDFTENYYYKRNGNIIDITESKTDDKDCLYIKDGKLYVGVSIKE